MKKSFLVILFSLIALSSFTQTDEELNHELYVATKIICIDAFNFRNSLATSKHIYDSDIEQMESYYTSAKEHCDRLTSVDRVNYNKWGNFLLTLIKADLGIVYALGDRDQKAYDLLKDCSWDLANYAEDKGLLSFRVIDGEMSITLQQKVVKSKSLDCFKALGTVCGVLEDWETSMNYWHVILDIPRLAPGDRYFANSGIIIIKKHTKVEDVELLDAYLTNFRILSYTKSKDRLAMTGYVDPDELYNSASTLSDKHPEFGKSYVVDTTGARDFIELGNYERSAQLFTKLLETDKGTNILAGWGIFSGIQVNDTKLVNLAIQNLERGDYAGYCFAFKMLKEGYQFLENDKKAKYWGKKEDKCWDR